MLQLVRVVDVMVLLTLMVPPGGVAGDAPGAADAAGVAGVLQFTPSLVMRMVRVL